MPANVQDNILVKDPKTLEERQKVAQEFAAQFKISLPILVDAIDDPMERIFAAWPDRIYVIDAEGKIAYKGGPGPGGFRVAEVPPVMDKLLGIPPTNLSLNQDQPRPAGPGVPPEMRQRLGMMLNRMGLNDKEIEQVTQSLDKKMNAYRDVVEARTVLMREIRNPNDVEKALNAYVDAQKKYAAAVEKIDKDLDAAIGYSKKPHILATLTGMGLIGVSPSPPFGGMMGGAGRPGGFGGQPGR